MRQTVVPPDLPNLALHGYRVHSMLITLLDVAASDAFSKLR